MNFDSRQRWVFAAFFMLAAIGFLLPFWPLAALGVMLAALSGNWLGALATGILLDLAWGAPVGLAHFLYFPFTVIAVVAILARWWGSEYFISRSPPEHL